MKIHKLLICLFITFLWNCQGANQRTDSDKLVSPDSTQMVSFKGRDVDLKPYVEGFPYSNFNPVMAADKMYYMKQSGKTELLELSLSESGNADLSRGVKVSDIDFSLRNVWSMRYNKHDDHLYWLGDELNDEVINLTRLNPETGSVEKLTDEPYIFGFGWNEQQTKVAYVPRLGVNEERQGELRILDLNTLIETTVAQDIAEMRFTWGQPSWQPEGKGVVIKALKNADRTYGNLIYFDLETEKQTVITDASIDRTSVVAYYDWLDKNTFLYDSNEDGFNNVYSYNIAEQKSMQLTYFTTDLGTSKILTIEGNKYLFATTSSPIETQVYLLSLPDGKIVLEQKSDELLGVYDSQDDKMLVSATSNSTMFRIDEVTVSTEKLTFKTVVDVSEELRSNIYKADVERVSYPTFDVDPATGKPREIHAYLYKPKKPVPEKDRVVLIQSFYGGGNYFSMRYQILADAGIYVLSPSPRGSEGFGKEFYALNDKDLGGNEIIDVFYAAKFISEKLNISPKNIGVFGGSHGGYATMRALTFPEEVNGNKVDFDWGFGISHAGFSDIIHFYENCNIPDWVTLEAGDPKTEAEKLNDRSPLYHADKMKGQLLLTHGTNDSRVPIAGSEMMADSLKKYDKEFTFVKFEDQGHGIKGLENTITMYQTWFDFLEKVTKD